MDVSNISTANESYNCVCAASSVYGEECPNRLTPYEGGNGTFADPCRNLNFGYLHQRHVDRGKQDPALYLIQTLDCGYSVRSNRAFQLNQIVIQDANRENGPIYQQNLPDRWDNSVEILSKVREMSKQSVNVC